MKQQELVARTAKTAGVTKAVADSVIKALVATITTALQEGKSPRILDLANFSTKLQPAKSGKVAGNSYSSPEKTVPTVKLAKSIKSAVAGI